MRCSRSFRSLIFQRFPVLVNHPDGHAYAKIIQYVLWTTRTDRATGKLLMPFNIVADLIGLNSHNKRFRASAWIDNFSRDVFPLRPTEYRYVDRMARCIDPDVPDDILDALHADRQSEDRSGWVWFTDGSSVSRRRLQQAIHEEENAIIAVARAAGKDHPAGALMDYLVVQPQDCLQRVLGRNWPSVKEAVFRLPRETTKQVATANWCERVLDSLHERRTSYYGAAHNSPRIYAIGTTIHLLPRKLRQLALTGGVELDLKAAQLAIVSHLWGVSNLPEFLSNHDRDIWAEFLGWMDAPPECKPVLKIGVYGIVFGMGQAKVRETLAHGTDKQEGLGEDGAAQFLEHPLIRDLLAARTRVLKGIQMDRGAEDAFGRRVKASWDANTKKWNAPSVAAQVVQSWEMRLMLSLVPVLRAERQLYCLSFLHDGLTVWCGDSSKRRKHLTRLKSAVHTEAKRWSIPTKLEEKVLDGCGED